MKTPTKPKFDTTNYVFKTPVSQIQEWLKNFEDMCDDPDVDWPVAQEQQLYCILKRDVETALQNNEDHVLLNAIENKVCGFYVKSRSKPKKKSKQGEHYDRTI